MKSIIRLLFLIALSAPSIAAADCGTPAGFKRIGSVAWRITPSGFTDVAGFDRLTPDVPADVPQIIQTLGQYSTGRAIHIVTDADQMHLCWDMTVGDAYGPVNSVNSTSGIDVYYRLPGASTWRFFEVGVAKNETSNQRTISLGASAQREFLIYLPMGRRTTLFRIEVPTQFSVSPGPAPAAKPMIVYGSSIEQGSGISRPGIGWPALLSRAWQRDVINLGFAGSCTMVSGMADVLSRIDGSILLIDCFPNMTAAQITAQLHGFVEDIAAARPLMPIYILQDRLNPSWPTTTYFTDRQAANLAAMTPIMQTLTTEHSNVHFVPSTDFLGDDGEGTADGSHPSDLGNWRWSADLQTLITPP